VCFNNHSGSIYTVKLASHYIPERVANYKLLYQAHRCMNCLENAKSKEFNNLSSLRPTKLYKMNGQSEPS